MPTLHELQRSFAAGLRGAQHGAEEWAASDGIPAAARLRVYGNNSRALFEQALELTYPVVRRRVGHDYFRQLAHFYRQAHPSCAGDLHEVGRRFPPFLAAHLAGGPYAWLAELATLEWAVAAAAVAADSSIAAAETLAALAPDALAAVRLRFVPSLQRVAGTVPVLSVWRANQPPAEPGDVDLAPGPEYVVVHRATDGVQLRGIALAEFDFIAALERGGTFEAAVDDSALPLDLLPGLLQWLFADAAVAAVIAPSAR